MGKETPRDLGGEGRKRQSGSGVGRAKAQPSVIGVETTTKIYELEAKLRGHNLSLMDRVAILDAIAELDRTVRVAARK